MTTDQTTADVADLLRRLRRREARRRGQPELTYRELAATTGWSLGIVAQYFSGKSLPPVDRFDTLTRLLGASPAEQGRLATARDRADEHRRRAVPAAATGRRADIRLLGTVEVDGPAGAAALVGARQRTLVGLLALNAGVALSQTRLVDALWAEEPPRTAVKSLYSHVARVRQALDACGLPGVLLTQGSGYRLAVRPDNVDAGRFTEALARAREALAGGAVDDAVARLRDGLALWRGDALADAAPAGWGLSEVERLHEARLGASEDLWDACLRLGEHAAAAAELERLLVAHPDRERLVELLMLALYRCGRHAEAIEAYQRLRGRLVDQWGIEPGPRLGRLYTAMLRRDQDLDVDRPEEIGARRPAQLPPRVGHFTGRSAELSTLDGLLRRTPRVGVVCGPAGMGKTALALQWAHRVAARYPDGQLYLDLRGHDPAEALPVSDALHHLLRGLDVPPAQVPADSGEQVSLYRSRLHGRRMLILLDNVASADQVTALVPPSATSLALVTSRHQLPGLAVDHAVLGVDLEVLGPADALALLRRVLGPERVAGEPDATGDLIELCGRMPLALRIAAAKLATRPVRPIAELVRELAGNDRLTALAIPGDSRSVRTVFASAYQALSEPAARLFRRMGLFPGAAFALELAAAVVGTTPARAGAALDELAGAHVLTRIDAGRYRFHDLLRLYAAERVEPDETGPAWDRVGAWYLAVADAANRILDPVRDRAGPVAVRPPVTVPFPPRHEEALAFLEGERANLVPVVRHLGECGHDRAAWQLTYLFTSFQTLRGNWPDQVEACRQGLAAAQRAGDPAAEALMRSGLGVACNAVQRHEEALEHLHWASEHMRDSGDRRGHATALNNMAFAYGRLGRLDAAVGAFERALALHTADANPPGIALALNNLGHMHTLMGQPERARQYLGRALTLTREIGHAGLEAATLHSLGEARLAEADHDGALDHFGQALAIRRQRGERRHEADTLNLVGLTHRGRGDIAAAAAHFRQALALSQELGDRHLETTTRGYLRAGVTTAAPHRA